MDVFNISLQPTCIYSEDDCAQCVSRVDFNDLLSRPQFVLLS